MLCAICRKNEATRELLLPKAPLPTRPMSPRACGQCADRLKENAARIGVSIAHVPLPEARNTADASPASTRRWLVGPAARRPRDLDDSEAAPAVRSGRILESGAYVAAPQVVRVSQAIHRVVQDILWPGCRSTGARTPGETMLLAVLADDACDEGAATRARGAGTNQGGK